MAGIRDLQNWLKEVFSPGRGGDTRRPDGGTSCYRPMRRKNPEEREAQAKAAEYAAEQQQIPYVHTGFTNMNPPAGGAYSQVPMNDPYGYGAAQAARQQEQQAYAPQAYTGTVTGNNISYMPGAYAPETGYAPQAQEGTPQGGAFSHVVHILTMTSLKSCYEAIECMKNGESLIVTLDAIEDGGESIRCQDMLCGAAFTLGCTVRMLQGGAVVLIAPSGVQVLPEQTRAQAWTDPMSAQWPGQMNAAPQQESAPRRERRVSQNAAGWNQASSETNRYWNPYTGTMPAAAGDYGTYGGYGYYARE